MNKRKIYCLIPEDMYKVLTQKHNLNGVLRLLFSPMDSVEEYQNISNRIIDVRQSLDDLQNEMVKNFKSNEVLGNLPLLFIRDRASRAEACYLRWRNATNNRSGEFAWQNIITDPKQPKIVKETLVQVEKERITFNMQVAILTHIMRQLRECREKIEKIENLAKMNG